jgi:hypothetical protein
MIEFKRVLVPLDGSPLAERALPVAMALAQKLDSTIVLFRALEISAPSIPALYPDTALSLAREAHEHVRTEVEQYLAAKEGECDGDRLDCDVDPWARRVGPLDLWERSGQGGPAQPLPGAAGALTKGFQRVPARSPRLRGLFAGAGEAPRRAAVRPGFDDRRKELD